MSAEEDIIDAARFAIRFIGCLVLAGLGLVALAVALIVGLLS
jgi:hypothetical protein